MPSKHLPKIESQSQLLTIVLGDLQSVIDEIKARVAVVLENDQWAPLMPFVHFSSGVVVATIPHNVALSVKGPGERVFAAAAVLDLERCKADTLVYQVHIIDEIVS